MKRRLVRAWDWCTGWLWALLERVAPNLAYRWHYAEVEARIRAAMGEVAARDAEDFQAEVDRVMAQGDDAVTRGVAPELVDRLGAHLRGPE